MTKRAKRERRPHGQPLAWWEEQAREACDAALRAINLADHAVAALATCEGQGQTERARRRLSHRAWWIARKATEAMMLRDDDPGIEWIDGAGEAHAGSVYEQCLRYVATCAAFVQEEPERALDHAADLLRTIARLDLPNVEDVGCVPFKVVSWLLKVTDGRALPGAYTPHGALARIALTSRGERPTKAATKREADKMTRPRRK